MSPKLFQLVEKKDADLEKVKERIEKNLADWYPSNLQRGPTASDERKGRHSYANEVVYWLSLQVFRQWFSNALVNGANRRAIDGGWSFFLVLSMADRSYLNAEDIKKWHENFPMTGRSSRNIVKHLDEIKKGIRQFIMPLFSNLCYLDTSHWPVNCFTCTVVKRDDINNLFDAEQDFLWVPPENNYIEDYVQKVPSTECNLVLDSSAPGNAKSGSSATQ
jgi:hypothetical protein